jgi:drug/metabolite transporter (DMT)-like permease
VSTPNAAPVSSSLPNPPGYALGVTAIVLTLVGWTSIPLFLRYFTGDIDAWTANGWRYALSALIWAPVLLWAAWRQRTPPGLWRAALVPSIFNAGGQICFGLAPYYVEPGLMTFSLRLQIVFLTFGAAILFAAERRVIRTPLFLVGLAMVIFGTLATVVQRPGGLGGGTALGVGLAIASGLLYASYALSVRKWMMGMNPIIAFAAVSQYTGAVLVLLMLALGRSISTGLWDAGLSALDLSGWKLGMLALSSLVGIGLGHTFYFFSIARLGLAVSASVVQLQPVTVSIASLIIFGEILTRGQWACGVLAIVGAGVILYAQSRTRPALGAPAPVQTTHEKPA